MNMATTTTKALPELLTDLSYHLDSAKQAVPDSGNLLPPGHGISLLDTKNEIFLTYLHNLIFLILLKIRDHRPGTSSEQDVALAQDAGTTNDVQAQVVKKLIEARVSLERGVKRLETDLNYQINKVVQAADDAAMRPTAMAGQHDKERRKRVNGAEKEDDVSEETGDEDASDAEAQADSTTVSDLQYRPNPAAFQRPAEHSQDGTSAYSGKTRDGIYRPPRITATAMPLSGASAQARVEERRKREQRRAQKSATLDEFINTEYSSAPLAEASIGSGLQRSGRYTAGNNGILSERERQRERERTEYEEGHFVRLPGESKKEKRERRKREGGPAGGDERMGYGGEDWRMLGDGVDRIERLTRRNREAGNVAEVLARSRKRKMAGDHGDAANESARMGSGFQKRVKSLDGRKRTTRGAGRPIKV